MTEREFIDRAIVTLWQAMRDMSGETITSADNELWRALGSHTAALKYIDDATSGLS